MDINLELYKVFYYRGHDAELSEASRQLFTHQSAVSQAVKNLAKKLGQYSCLVRMYQTGHT